MRIHDLPTPCAVMDLDVVERNAEAMAAKADALGVRLRPHVKTHKIPHVARLQTPGPFKGITVSTLAEAHHFAKHGFTDITWALPLPPSRLAEAAELAERIDLGVLVDTPATAARLVEARRPMRVWLKIDCGYHRAGVDPTDPASMDLLRTLMEADHLDVRGVLTHAGHSYGCKDDPEGLLAIARQERDAVVDFAARADHAGLGFRHVSVGSTPTCSVIDDLTGVTEIRPGNYVFFDLHQLGLGVCAVEDIALSVVASVIGQHMGRMVLDCGALALSKDPGHGEGYGRVFDLDGEELPIALHGLSQEHGLAKGYVPGLEKVRVLPNHSCLVAALHPVIYGVRGDEVVGQWAPVRGW
ncbi:MAG: DSD1 family PLP-dependent enzyme [Deltaproteobacteria bacterium]|nr:MAG: DSD1 family PLP-dependent enzyme [Deltaproteobacteria bacterium]